MRVSIITITYNNSHSIAEAINSVISQTYSDIEYIVVDGKSKDNTVDVIRSFGDKIARFISEPDKGIYDALNKGIAMATGDLIGFLHSDDFFPSTDTIQHVVDAFKANDTDSLYGDLQYVNKQHTSKVLRNWRSGNFSLRQLKLGWMPPHPTLYVKRWVYQKYGGFDTSLDISGDYDTMLRFLGKYKISTQYLPEVMVKMRVGGASNKSIKNIIQKSWEDWVAIRNNEFGNLYTLLFKNLRKVPQFIP